MVQIAGENFRDIYPHADALRDFAREMMPRLRRSLDLFTDFPAYMNGEFREFGLLEPYANGHFRSTLVGEQTVVDDLNFHRRFTARLRNCGTANRA